MEIGKLLPKSKLAQSIIWEAFHHRYLQEGERRENFFDEEYIGKESKLNPSQIKKIYAGDYKSIRRHFKKTLLGSWLIQKKNPRTRGKKTEFEIKKEMYQKFKDTYENWKNTHVKALEDMTDFLIRACTLLSELKKGEQSVSELKEFGQKNLE